MDCTLSCSGTAFRIASVAGVLIGMTACGSPVGNPDPILLPPEVSDFNGQYGITHTFSVPGTARSIGCTGDAQLSSDFALAFSGTIGIHASGACAALPDRDGAIVGSIRDETITFSIDGLQDALGVIGCSATGGVRNFEGSFSTRLVGNVKRVQTFRGILDARALCDVESGETTARWEIRATRR